MRAIVLSVCVLVYAAAFAGDAPAPNPEPKSPAPLTAGETANIEKLIKALDSDDFETRNKAQNELTGMGLRIEPLIVARLGAAPSGKESAEVRDALKRVQRAFDAIHEQEELERTLRELDVAVKESPQHYIAPDPAVRERLNARITFEFVDTSMSDAMKFIRENSGVSVVLDPALQGANITLRVSMMETNLALQWICKLAQAETVVRGKIVIVTTPDRANKLNRRPPPDASKK